MRRIMTLAALSLFVLCMHLNPVALKAGAPTPATAPATAPLQFLIVAPNALHETLGEFVEYKRTQLSVELVSLEKILATTAGVDDPERLKHYLYAQWHERHIRYVLLVGDADLLPVRYMVLDRVTPAAFDYSFYACDLYYADLARADGSFDDWNGNKDSFHGLYFGEVRGEKNKSDPVNYDRVHYRPEIALGRWPVSNVEQLRTLVTKSIRYEKALRDGSKPGLRRAALMSVGGWVDSRGVMDSIATKLGERWDVQKRYYADAGRNDHTPPPSEAEAVSALNEGVGLMMHAGHGNGDVWEQCISSRSIAKMNDADRLPVMISAGCSTAIFANEPPYTSYTDIDGKFHIGTYAKEVFLAPPPPPAAYQKGSVKQTGLAKKLLLSGPNGAVAYIGCNTGSQPCGLTLLVGFATALQTQKDPRLGDCWASAVAYYYEHEHLDRLVPNNDWYPPSIFFQAMKFMMFGDPTLPLPGAKQ